VASLTVTDFLFWFGIVANAMTELAGLIAIAGAVWTFLAVRAWTLPTGSTRACHLA
jgi:hypothetical protein